MKKNNSEAEADSSSSDSSCFVAPVTASNLEEDSLVRVYTSSIVFAYLSDELLFLELCISLLFGLGEYLFWKRTKKNHKLTTSTTWVWFIMYFCQFILVMRLSKVLHNLMLC